MRPTASPIARFVGVGAMLLAAGLATSTYAARQRAMPRSGGGMPRSGGGAPRASAPVYRGGSPRSSVARPALPTARTPAVGRYAPLPRGTANGIARYGYGYGYGTGYGYGYYPGYGYGYPCWGWGAGYGWWGDGWYAGFYGGAWWGWPYYGYPAYGPYYGPWYGPSDGDYEANFEAPPPTGPAIVETEVTPSKATVLLDGETVGFASDYDGKWDKLSVAPGSHTIAFQHAGYRTLTISFEARPHGTYVLNDALVPGEGEDHRSLPAPAPAPAPVEAAPPRPQPPTAPSSGPASIGRLRVHAEPPDAAVYLDGEYLGLAVELGRIHSALAVPTGAHRVEAVKPGFASGSRAIEVGDSDVVSVELILQPERPAAPVN